MEKAAAGPAPLVELQLKNIKYAPKKEDEGKNKTSNNYNNKEEGNKKKE